ncbi:hypothetical protein PYW07_006238 [Mythimna separata]|uniref:HTH psq-type domain-containing protein n=1 Tax=Mythimna separata TaxID=271217 RepID=A0AAD7YVY5_MYTSE|nr:hypothetical protein PYW07_006238 [Mythimna separata]
MREAINEAKKSSIKGASVKYGIPYSTLQRRVKTGSSIKKLGRFTPIFTEAEELELVQHLKDLDALFYGLTKTEFLQLVDGIAVNSQPSAVRSSPGTQPAAVIQKVLAEQTTAEPAVNQHTESLPPMAAESQELNVAYEIRCFREELSAMRVELRLFRDEMASLKADVGSCGERFDNKNQKCHYVRMSNRKAYKNRKAHKSREYDKQKIYNKSLFLTI